MAADNAAAPVVFFIKGPVVDKKIASGAQPVRGPDSVSILAALAFFPRGDWLPPVGGVLFAFF